MREMDININFGFYGGGDAEDEVSDVEFSDELYDWIHDYYCETGDNELNEICEMKNMPRKLKSELKKIVKDLREDTISLQYENGNECDPDTGEEYDWDSAYVLMYIQIPEEWDEN